MGFAPGGDRFTIILDFFCNTSGNSGVIQNGDVCRNASVSVGLPETGKQDQSAWMGKKYVQEYQEDVVGLAP